MAWVIVKLDGAPMYYSLSQRRQTGHPGGAWTGDMGQAFRCARREDAELLAGFVAPHDAPLCQYQEVA